MVTNRDHPTRSCARRSSVLPLLCLVVACGPTRGSEAPSPQADARQVLHLAESEHWRVKLATNEGDTLVGHVTLQGDRVRLSGTTRRVDIGELRAIHREAATIGSSRDGFLRAGAAIGLAVSAPLALLLLLYGEWGMALTVLGAGLMGGALLGSATGTIDEPGRIEWIEVWPTEED